MASTSTDVNLAECAWGGMLTVEEVNAATKKMLEDDKFVGCTVLYWASYNCGIEAVEAIINKGVDVNQLSEYVSIVIIIYYLS
jgi:hypothetical protein